MKSAKPTILLHSTASFRINISRNSERLSLNQCQSCANYLIACSVVSQLLQVVYIALTCWNQRAIIKFNLIKDLDEEYFTRCHTMMCQGSDKNATTFRTLFYPSLADTAIKAGVERCGQHSDYGTFTLLFQDDIGGLEVTLI